MRKLLHTLLIFACTGQLSAQLINYATPLVQTDIVDAIKVLPNGMITSADNGYYPGYNLTAQGGEYIISPAEMQAAGFYAGDLITSLAWTVTQGQQIQTTGAFSLGVKNTTTETVYDVLYSTEYIYTSSLTIPNQAGQMVFQFVNPFEYAGNGVHVYFYYQTNVFSGINPMFQTAVNTSSIYTGYKCRIYSGNAALTEYHNNRPVTTLGKYSCRMPYFLLSNYTDNSSTITWQGAGNYQIEYGVSPYVQGSGGIVLPQINSTTESNSYTINNLLPGKTYDIYIRNVCSGNDNSQWRKGLIATSNSNTVTTFPYIENFESLANQITTGWTRIMSGSTNTNWDLTDNFIKLKDWSAGEVNRKIYCRPLALMANTTYIISFDYQNFWFASSLVPDSGNPPALNVLINLNPTENGATVLASINSISNTDYLSYTFQYTPQNSGTYYFGLNGVFAENPTVSEYYSNTIGFNQLRVDNFKVETENLNINTHLKNNLTLFPNPATDVLNFSQPLTAIKIYDLTGRLIQSYIENTEKIDVSAFAKGNYLVHGKTGLGENVVSKFIKF